MKKEIVRDDNIINVVNEVQKLLGKDEKNRTFEDLKKIRQMKLKN